MTPVILSEAKDLLWAALVAARWLAIAIALLGAIDPAIMSMRRVKPEIALVIADRRDSTLARRVEAQLEDDYQVIRGAYSGAAATIVVGNSLPDRLPSGMVFGVREQRALDFKSVQMARVATTEARIPVAVLWRAGGSRESRVDLLADGIVVDRAVSRNASSLTDSATLSVTPTRTGALRLQARAIAGDDTIFADGVTEVVDAPHAVLFFDRRPSWMSTFTRRALERDRRFAVASRVITSKGISTDAGRPPSSLADPAVLELYDAIVIGAPELLATSDVAGLESFLRRRGGAVVMLFDERPTGGIYDRITGASRWASATLRAPITGAMPEDSASLRLTEAAWPARIPTDATVRVAANVNGEQRPMVWSTIVGRGEVIVSSALDAWKFRDPATSAFDEFWTATVSRAAREAVPAVDVRLSQAIVEPGEEIGVTVVARDSGAAVEAKIESDSGAAPVRLWPGERAGSYEGRIVAPDRTGELRVTATASGARGSKSIVVTPSVHRVVPNDSAAIAALARASGGAVVEIGEIEAALRGRVADEQRNERSWPMRSGWWILPFVGLLGIEWFARRRRGLA